MSTGGYPDCEECYGDGGRWDPEVQDQWYHCRPCARRDEREPKLAECGAVNVDANGSEVA